MEQLDIFQAAYADIPIRDQRDLMERPFFSLAKVPRTKPIKYAVGGVKVTVMPGSDIGMATIWDADILIWVATQLTEALDRGGEVSPVIQFHPYALLKGIRRHVGGSQYQNLLGALRRLHSTSIETNIRDKGKKGWSFHWIEEWGYHEDENGKPIGMTITIPKWLYDGIVDSGGVLTIHPDYFLLTGGIERWLYRVARKHAGNQEGGWRFTMKQLYEKSGSVAKFANFAIDVRKVAAANSLPEYAVDISRNEKGEEMVNLFRRIIIG